MKKKNLFGFIMLLSLVILGVVQLNASDVLGVDEFPDEDLMEVGYDHGDISDSSIEIATNAYSMIDRQQSHMAVGLGYDVPDADSTDGESLGWSVGTEDDEGSQIYNAGPADYKDSLYGDDETGIGAKVTNDEGYLQFYNNTESKMAMDIPYDYFKQIDNKIEDTDNIAGIAVWVDFNNNGDYESDEYFYQEVNAYDFDETDFPNSGPSFIYEKSVSFNIKIPDEVAEKTTMHIVMSTDQASLTSDQGNTKKYSGYGEIEDYNVQFLNDEIIDTCVPPEYLNYNRFYSENKPTINTTASGETTTSSITFKNIDLQAFNTEIDITIEAEYLTSDNGYGTVDYPNSISETEYGWPVIYSYRISSDSNNAKTMKIETTITESDTGELFPLQLMNTYYDLDGDDEAQRLNQGDYFDYSSFRVEDDSQIELTDGNFVINSDDVVESGMVDQASTQSASISTTRNSYFKNVYWTNSQGKGGITELNYPSVYTKYNPCVQEKLTKEVVSPSDGSVEDSDIVEYKLSIESLQFLKNEINFIDELESQYLTYDSIDYDKIEVSDENGGKVDYEYTDNSSADNGLDITLTGDFSVGTTFSIVFNAKVESPPEGVTIDNYALAYVDGIETNEDDATVSTGEIVNPNDGDITSFKTVIDSDGDGKVQEDEDVTYQIIVHNTSDEAVDNVSVTDDISGQLSEYFDITGDEVLTITSQDQNTITTTPDSSSVELTVDDLTKGITFTSIESSDDVIIEFTLTALEYLPESDDILNIATVEDPTYGPHYPGAEIVTEGTPDTVISKSVTDENSDDMLSYGETLTYTIEVENISKVAATDVNVKDSILQDLPSYLKYNNDLVISSTSNTSGDITLGNYVIEKIDAEEKVTLTYSVTMNQRLNSDDEINIVNIATDNGEEPGETCEDNTENQDCSDVTTRITPETNIEKSVVDDNGNGVAEAGDKLTYTIDINNPDNDVAALDVNVRDSMLENLPSYLTYDGGFTVTDGVDYTGTLEGGDLVITSIEPDSTVTITYIVVLTAIEEGIDELVNVVTDNGEDPSDTCAEDLAGIDCSEASIPTNPETNIEKSVVDKNGNLVAEEGEELTYSIDVTNPDTDTTAYTIAVRDSMLENLPSYLTYDRGFTVTDGVDYTGTLAGGDLVITSIEPDSTVTITYTLVLTTIEEGIDELVNVVTDNGEEPSDACDEDLAGIDCSEASIPTNPETNIEKSVVDENGNLVAEAGEELTYSIDVTNPDEATTAYAIAVRDSMLENLPTYLTYDGTVSINRSSYTGSLTDGDFALESIAPGETVTITYIVELTTIEEGIDELLNIVTDNGEEPADTCADELAGIDCSEASIPTNPETNIEKSVVDENSNGVAEAGEELTYSIDVTNPDTDTTAYAIAVRDSMLENLPSYLTYDGEFTVTDGVDYTGSLTSGDFVITSIEADSTVTITYTVVLTTIEEGIDELVNVATDNGEEPSDTCDEVLAGIDCSQADMSIAPVEEDEPEVSDTGFKYSLYSIIAILVLMLLLLSTKKYINNRK